MRLGIVQSTSTPAEVAADAAAAAGWIAMAAVRGCEAVLFPELFLGGYSVAGWQSRAIAPGDPRLAPLLEATAAGGPVALVGATLAESGGPAIATLVIRDGAIAAIYRKMHLHPPERAVFVAGTEPCVLEIGGMRVGLAICADTGVPEHAYACAHLGARLYVVGGLFGTGQGQQEIATILPTLARRTGLWVALSNHVGPADAWIGCGRSAVWTPDGRIHSDIPSVEPQLLVVEIEE